MPFDLRNSLKSVRASVGRAWSRAPVTTLVIVLVVGLHLAKLGTSLFWSGGRRGIDGAFGAVVALEFYRMERPQDPNSPWVPIKQLEGPFDLWDGQWWRIPISSLHHAGLIHLAANVFSLWYLGILLEPRMRRVWYLLFLLSALTISMIPEFLMEHYVVGISGGLCAMFGMLMAMRNRDWRLREILTDNVVVVSLAILVAFVPLTALNMINIANAAHFAGLIYGWIAGQVFFGGLAAWHVSRVLFLGSHLAIPLAFYAIVHPSGNGRYLWHEAQFAREHKKREEYERDLKQAVQADPGLVDCWNELAEYQAADDGNLLEAWRTATTGLRYNRSDDRAAEIARDIYSHLTTREQRADAIRILQEEFGDDAVKWQERLAPSTRRLPLIPWAKDVPPQPDRRIVPKAPENAEEGRRT